MIPLLFMGEECAAREPFLYFTDHQGELADAVREGRRKEFGEFGRFGEGATPASPRPQRGGDLRARRRPGSWPIATRLARLLPATAGNPS